jgi:hypothetical protein
LLTARLENRARTSTWFAKLGSRSSSAGTMASHMTPPSVEYSQAMPEEMIKAYDILRPIIGLPDNMPDIFKELLA